MINKILKKESVLDVERGPGGKSFQLVDFGYKVKSIEISKKRLVTFNNNLKRLNLNTEVINKDFLNLNVKEKFDCIFN